MLGDRVCLLQPVEVLNKVVGLEGYFGLITSGVARLVVEAGPDPDDAPLESCCASSEDDLVRGLVCRDLRMRRQYENEKPWMRGTSGIPNERKKYWGMPFSC